MKELTIQEKAEAYDMAIVRAKRMFSEEEINYLFTELAESDDEKIRKEILNYIDKATGCKRWITWLKKQEFIKKEYTFKAIPRLLEMIQPTDRAKLYCQKLIDSLEQEGYSTDAKIVKNRLKIMNGEKVAMATMDEQKPDDKAKPKFHEGDWCIDNEDGTIFQIVKVLDKTYKYRTNEGKEYSCSHYSLELDARLWNIQDAKDGDVLTAHECLVLFREIDGLNIRCYFTYHFMNNPSFYVYTLQNKDAFQPATKEQRNQLEKSMADAGYAFDFDKKELKKIEDEEYDGDDYGIDSLWHARHILKKTIGKVDGYQSDDGILEHKCAISAVDRLYKHSIAWSEEDEHWMQKVIDFMNHPDLIKATPTLAKDTINWLKSLKDRILLKSNG